MVAAKSMIQKTLDHISLYGILLAIVAATIFHFTTIDWSHVAIIAVVLVLFRFEKINVNFIVTLTLFYSVSLFALQRYDTDKINEIIIYQLLPVILMVTFYFYMTRSGRFLTLMNRFAYYVNRLGKFLTKPLPEKYKKSTYILVAILFSYFTLFTFQGFFGVYGGLIVLFTGLHIARFLLIKSKQKTFLYIVMFIYIAIYNLTLTHGLTLLLDDPLAYVYFYLPTIIIPVLFAVVYQWQYLQD